MKLLALIFDVDGTLAETERDGHRPAFNAAFAEAGLNWNWDVTLYGELLKVAGGKERIHHYAQHYDPALAARPNFDSLVAKLHAVKTQRYLALVEAGALCLRPGVARLLESARAAGLRLAIASTTTPINVTTLLRARLGTAAPEGFDVIAAGDVVAAKKPAPDIYQYCLAQLGLPASACLAIEDSAAVLASAHAAGIPTLVTPSQYSRNQNFDHALAVLPDLGDTSLEQIRQLVSRSSSTAIPA